MVTDFPEISRKFEGLRLELVYRNFALHVVQQKSGPRPICAAYEKSVTQSPHLCLCSLLISDSCALGCARDTLRRPSAWTSLFSLYSASQQSASSRLSSYSQSVRQRYFTVPPRAHRAHPSAGSPSSGTPGLRVSAAPGLTSLEPPRNAYFARLVFFPPYITAFKAS